MNNLKSQKGAISLLVLITILFMTSFLVSTYIIGANKLQSELERTKEIKEIYDNHDEAEDTYNSYFEGNVINIYTVEQLLNIGKGTTLEIDGKMYTFSEDAVYVLMADLEFDVDNYSELLGENTDWIPIDETNYIFDHNGHTITVTNLEDVTTIY